MNELELKQLWMEANDNLVESITISRKNMDDIAQLQVHSLLSSMKPIKLFTLLIGIMWVVIGGFALSSIYLNAFSEANKFFLFSATVQVVLTAIALLIYIYQLVKIYQVDVSDSILTTQSTLAQLKVSTLWVTRILFLQLPVWTTFWWNETMLSDWSIVQWLILLLCTGSFTFLALWLFFNIKYKNRNKKWFKLIFRGKEWTPLMKSLNLLEQVKEYNMDTTAKAKPYISR